MPRIVRIACCSVMLLSCSAMSSQADTGGRIKTAVWTIRAGEGVVPAKLLSDRAFGSYESYRPTPLPPPMVHQYPFGPGVGPGWYGAGAYGPYGFGPWGYGTGFFRPAWYGPAWVGPGWMPGPWLPRGPMPYGYFPRYGWNAYYGLGRVPLLPPDGPFVEP